MRRIALALLLAGAALAHAETPEDRLSDVFAAIEANEIETALARVEGLLRDYPNFRLAHLVRGDLLLARSRPLQTFGNVVKTVPQERVEGLREEALARLRASGRPTTCCPATCCSFTPGRSMRSWSIRAARGCTSTRTTAAARGSPPTTT
jgi:hypothetical protein